MWLLCDRAILPLVVRSIFLHQESKHLFKKKNCLRQKDFNLLNVKVPIWMQKMFENSEGKVNTRYIHLYPLHLLHRSVCTQNPRSLTNIHLIKYTKVHLLLSKCIGTPTTLSISISWAQPSRCDLFHTGTWADLYKYVLMLVNELIYNGQTGGMNSPVTCKHHKSCTKHTQTRHDRKWSHHRRNKSVTRWRMRSRRSDKAQKRIRETLYETQTPVCEDCLWHAET